MRAEEWRQIKGYPDYCVSSYGRIKSNRTKKEKYLKVCQNKDGYCVVSLFDRNDRQCQKFVHRLVAEAFIENPDGLQTVNHLDENKRNNYVENLEYVSIQDNLAYGTRVERMRKTMMERGHYLKIAKLRSRPVSQFTKDGQFVETYSSITDALTSLGKKTNCSGNISRCCQEKAKTAFGFIWFYQEDVPDKVFH